MSHGVIVKSVVYLIAATGAGWVLMTLTEPKPDRIKAISGTQSLDRVSDDLKRKHLIVQKLKEAASGKLNTTNKCMTFKHKSSHNFNIYTGKPPPQF